MDVLTLRTQLETTLVDALGVYTLANGMTTPAIEVRSVGEPLGGGTSVSGLEVVIVREPEPEPIRQYANERAFDRWTLYLVGWGGEVDLQAVAAKLLYVYPGSTASSISVPEGVGPRWQMRVEIRTNPDAALDLEAT
jgi:hypothetical protein